MQKPHIAIIGAGPGGLVLARILHLRGMHAVVFEGEDFASVRPQGWSLDMHPETGRFAIQSAGLEDEFSRIARYEDQETRIYDKYGKLLFKDAEDAAVGDRPEVERAQLRQMLLESLPRGVVRWGHKLSSIVPRANNTFETVFQNGMSEIFDFVVGADGAWSRTRALVSESRPIYTGVTFIELGIDDVDASYPELANLVGHGLMFALGDSKAIIAHRDANAHIGFYAALQVPEDWVRTDGVEVLSKAAMRTSLAAQFSGWSENLLGLIYKCGDVMEPRLIYALPVGHSWEHRPGITLLGDAAHLMSPFTGEGANLAMRDAADLALAFVEEDWKMGIRSYELAMFARAKESATGARNGINGAFSEDGASYMVQQMAGHHI